MKITPSYFNDTVTRFKPVHEKVEKKEISEQKITDRVTIGNSAQSKSALEPMSGYSPDTIRSETAKLDMEHESRADRLARIKNEINSGIYNISSEKVAEKMIGVHINDLI
ncbi:MAG: flagellar biosynthesis anti-sigma factor FlgM [Desulforegulaceae bacterium]|nr:flagellar biosynthesis anti-sigma factor FlgM [Desulforegulaceae bacterium]